MFKVTTEATWSEQVSEKENDYLWFQSAETTDEHWKAHIITGFYPWQLATVVANDNGPRCITSCDLESSLYRRGKQQATEHPFQGGQNHCSHFLLKTFWKQVVPNKLSLLRRKWKVSYSSLNAYQVACCVYARTRHWLWLLKAQGNHLVNQRDDHEKAENKPTWPQTLGLSHRSMLLPEKVPEKATRL